MKSDLTAQNVAMRVGHLKKNDLQLTFSAMVECQHLLEIVKGTKLELPILSAVFCCLCYRKVLVQVGCHYDTDNPLLAAKTAISPFQLEISVLDILYLGGG